MNVKKKKKAFQWFARFIKRLIRSFVALIALMIIGVAVCLGLLWFEHNTPVTLPVPTGPFTISRATYVWVDDKQTDKLAPLPGIKRELVAWIWYPSTGRQSPEMMEDYMPTPWRTAVERNRGTLISNFLTRDLSMVYTHSVRNSNVSPKQQMYPVVIMRAGLSALTLEYSTLAEDLASNGYIVVGFDAPYRTSVVVFPDGRVITRASENNPEIFSGQEQDRVLNKLLTAWCADIRFVLDQLERLNTSDLSDKFRGRIDMTRIGVFGHSLGGATAAQICHDDNRCKAGIDIDGAPIGNVVAEGLHKPFMFIISDYGEDLDSVNRQIRSNVQSIYDRLPVTDRLWITILGARHFNFGDLALLKDRYLFRLFGALGPVGERRGLAITSAYVHGFFDIYLKNAPDSLLKKASPLYPEVKFETR